MKWPCLALSAILGSLLVSCTPPKPRLADIVWEETLSQAQECGFDYVGELAAAEQGNLKSVQKLLRFSEKTDAAGGLGHGVVLVELLRLLSDPTFADVVRKESPQIRRTIRVSLEAGLDYGPLHENPDSLPQLFPLSFAATSVTLQ